MTTTETTTTVRDLLVALDQGMQRVAAAARAAGATEAQADEAARTALRNHLASLKGA